jgi:hypothetical protein
MPLKDILLSIDETQEKDTLFSLQIDAPELETMRALADSNEYQGISQLCMQLSGREIYDIRFLIYALYADFEDRGLLRLDESFDDLIDILKRCWEQIGPADRRDKYAKNSVSWLLKQIFIDLQTLQIEDGESWAGLLESCSQDHMSLIIDRAEGIKAPLNERLEDAAGPSFINLKELIDWLTEFKSLLPTPEPEGLIGDDDVDSLPSVEATTNFSQTPALSSWQISSGSVHLEILNRKLALFQEVLAQGEMVKAAVIAMDVNQLLESFDPKKYFPDLFSSYFTNMVNYGDEINGIIEMSGSPNWQALVNLYEVDLDKFKDIQI